MSDQDIILLSSELMSYPKILMDDLEFDVLNIKIINLLVNSL